MGASVNLAGQLTAASDGTTGVSYGYDGDRNRISQTVGGATTSLAWEGNVALPQLALERDGSGGLVRRYGYGVGRTSMTTPSTTAYYSSDALGSVTELSGVTGASLARFDRGPFGENETGTGVSPPVSGNPFAFTGEYRDPATGLYNLRARNYDTVTGRFLAPDPLGPQDSASTYAYVANNPLGFVDPSGMKRGACGSIKCWLNEKPVSRDLKFDGKIFGRVVGIGTACLAGAYAGETYIASPAGYWLALVSPEATVYLPLAGCVVGAAAAIAGYSGPKILPDHAGG